MLGAGGGVLGGLVCAAGVWTGDFLWFCLGALGIGVYQASAMYYRFAALEAVDAGRKGRASAYVLAGGVPPRCWRRAWRCGRATRWPSPSSAPIC